MQEVGKRPSPARRIGRSLGLAVALTATVASIAACGSSGSSSSSSSSAPAASSTSTASSSSSSSSGSLKTGLKVFVIPKNLGNNYFTVADSVKTGGALAALQALGETRYRDERLRPRRRPRSCPRSRRRSPKGANVLIVSATDPTALCPTLKSRDGPWRSPSSRTTRTRRPAATLFTNQASTAAIGTSEVDLLAKQIGEKGDIAIVSAAASAHQPERVDRLHEAGAQEVPEHAAGLDRVRKRRPDDRHPGHPAACSRSIRTWPGIISPTTVGIAAAAAVLDTPQYRGKVKLTGLGTPLSLKKFVDDGTINAFELWDPAKLGYLAAYAAVERRVEEDHRRTGPDVLAPASSARYTIGPDNTDPPRTADGVRQRRTSPSSISSTQPLTEAHGFGRRLTLPAEPALLRLRADTVSSAAPGAASAPARAGAVDARARQQGVRGCSARSSDVSLELLRRRGARPRRRERRREVDARSRSSPASISPTRRAPRRRSRRCS